MLMCILNGKFIFSICHLSILTAKLFQFKRGLICSRIRNNLNTEGASGLLKSFARPQLSWIEYLATNQGVRSSNLFGRATFYIITTIYAPVAQLDRVLGFEPRGQEFESLRARHSIDKMLSKKHNLFNSMQHIT